MAAEQHAGGGVSQVLMQSHCEDVRDRRYGDQRQLVGKCNGFSVRHNLPCQPISCTGSHTNSSVTDSLSIEIQRDGVPMVDHTSTGTFQIPFPQELLHESRQVAKPTTDQLRVEGWRNSWFSRLVEMLTGED
jgi:hypothetical protein